MKTEMLKLVKLLAKNDIDFNIGYDRGNFSVNLEIHGNCAVMAREVEGDALEVLGSVNRNFAHHTGPGITCYADGALKYFMNETLSFPMLELEVETQRDKSPALRRLYERLCIITADRRRHVREVFESSCWKDFNSFWRKYVGFEIGFADPECKKFHEALYGEFPPR